MSRLTYLAIDLSAVLFPFIFSFHPRLPFFRTWKALFPAIAAVGLTFVIWDYFFTCWGVWGFNPRYLTGLYIGHHPIEELSFFLCIPYACVFTFYCLADFVHMSRKVEDLATISLLIFLLLAASLHFRQRYTTTAFLSLAVLIAVCRYCLHISLLVKCYIVYFLLLLPFFIVNGLLTGTGPEKPVVWYNGHDIIGVRLLTMPLEDIFYGMELVLSNLLIYRWLSPKKEVINDHLSQDQFGQ